MRILLHVLGNGLGVLLAAHVVPGLSYTGGLLYLFVVGLVIGVINALVRPVLTLLSLPLIVLTLGLFYLVVNGAGLWIAAKLLPGLTSTGCLPAILGALVLSVVNWLVAALFEREGRE
jgi:putative membrane protein